MAETLNQIALEAAQAISDGWGEKEERRTAEQLMPFMRRAFQCEGLELDPPNPHIVNSLRAVMKEHDLSLDELKEFVSFHGYHIANGSR